MATESTKAALLRMRCEALKDIKSADRSFKKATKNHSTEVLSINKKITEIDRNIKRCDNGQSPKKMSIPIVVKRGRGRPKGSLNKVKRGRGRPKGSLNKVTKGLKNSKTLNDIVVEILFFSKRRLKLSDIVLKVAKTGYKHNTKDDFSKLVYASLYKLQQSNKVVKDKNKMYRMKK